MIYRAIGLMSGSSLDGLDIAFAEFTETGGKWNYQIVEAGCIPYTNEWKMALAASVNLPALDYQLLHTAYGHYTGETVNNFIDKYNLHHQVHLIASHGHTSFHLPAKKMTAQLGDGAAIAAATKLPVVSDLRSLDVAFGGQGAPIVPIGEKLLLGDFSYYLNIGGIANISVNNSGYIAYDVCAANRILNLLAAEKGMEYDDGGKLAASGKINEGLLYELNAMSYYSKPFPKSLDNSFGTDTIYPLIRNKNLSAEDALCTYTEHVAVQISYALLQHAQFAAPQKLLVTGGGAFNTYLIQRLEEKLAKNNIAVHLPDEKLIKYKEALIMALIGVLRWREEVNVLSSVTGATESSIGGALWLGAAG